MKNLSKLINARTDSNSAVSRISIVTVVLNDLEGLKRTYASLCHVDMDYEWIVVDGGSTDGTLEWLRSQPLPSGMVISEKDRGIYDAMNKGWLRSRGEWIYFLNAGDVLRRGLANLLDVSHVTDVVSARVALEDDRGCDLGRCHPVADAKRDDLRASNCIAHQGTILRRDLFNRFGGYSLQYSIQGDFEYWVRLQNAGARFHFVDEVVAGFVYNGVSSRRSNYLRAEAERRAILLRYGLLSAWQASWIQLRTKTLFHLKSLALSVLPTAWRRRLRPGAQQRRAS